MKKDTCFLIISLSIFSAVVGGYVGAMLRNNSEELSIRAAQRILGISDYKKDISGFEIYKKDSDALAIKYMNDIRTQATQAKQYPIDSQAPGNDKKNDKNQIKHSNVTSKEKGLYYEMGAKTPKTKYTSYSTKGHSKANGLNMTIEHPAKWTTKEGKRPHIVQLFNDGKSSSCVIEVLPTGKFGSVKQWEREFNRYSKEDMTQFGEVLFVQHTKYDRYPGVLIEATENTQRAGMNLYGHYLAHMFGYKDNLVTVLCISGGTTQEMADDLFTQDIFDFMQIGNSIILPDQLEAMTIENDTGSFVDKLSELLHGGPKQNAVDYDSGKSIYKQQILDKVKDVLTYESQPEVIQSDEVDGVHYSMSKSDKGHVVQITTEIPDEDITEVMDVFTKMVDIEKLKKFYETNDKKTLEQAVGAYNFIENANMRAAQWCEPYYSLKVLPSKMRAKFASRQQYAATLLKNAWGDNWKSIIKTMQKRLEPKMMQAAEYNYQATKSLAAEYNERLSREEYCKMLDEDSDYEVKHKDKLFKQLYPSIPNEEDVVPESQYVIYNHVSKIYHKPACDWVQKCGNNCLKTQKGVAIIDGGRPCHVCNP